MRGRRKSCPCLASPSPSLTLPALVVTPDSSAPMPPVSQTISPIPAVILCPFSRSAQDALSHLLDQVPSPPLSVHTSPLVLRSMRCRQQPHCFPKSPRSFISLMAFPFLPGSDSHRVFLQKCSSPELTIKLCVCVREREGEGEEREGEKAIQRSGNVRRHWRAARPGKPAKRHEPLTLGSV